jgi:hypothetical protein
MVDLYFRTPMHGLGLGVRHGGIEMLPPSHTVLIKSRRAI